MQMRDPRTILVTTVLMLLLAAGTAQAQHHQDDHSHGHDDQSTEHAHDDHAVAAHGDAHGAEHGDDHGDDHGGEFHLDNIITLLAGNLLSADQAAVVAAWLDPIFTLITAILIALWFISVGRKLKDRDPGRKQLFAEMLIGGLYNMFYQVLGGQARRFAPYLGTLFLFIYCNNLFGLIPLGHSSTASFVNTTLGLGLMTFIYVQYVGIRENGIGGYLYHFAGQPKSGIEWGFAILIFPLELMGELIKPVSLSLRLFGNIFGEDTLIAVMVVLGVQLMHFILNMVGAGGWTAYFPGIPFQVPFYAIALIGSTVQALVFTLLSTIYISLMLPHGHEEGAH